jgi:hypothetical protein
VDLNELRKMTVPKLREHAKGIADLAIAKAEGISYESSAVPKDDTSIGSIKQEIRALRKQKEEFLASSQARHQVERVRRKIKRLKRLTRKMAREKAPQEVSPPPAEASLPAPSRSLVTHCGS